MIHYFKRYQEAQIWHYYKLTNDQQPPACEILNFLGPVPRVDFMQYDLELLGHKIQYEALWEVGVRITASEYETAYQRATGNEFESFTQGKSVGS